MVYFRTMDELNHYLSIVPKTVLFNQATAQPAECGRQFRAVLNVKNKLREELSVENRFRAVLNVKNRFFHWAYFEFRQLSKDTCNCLSWTRLFFLFFSWEVCILCVPDWLFAQSWVTAEVSSGSLRVNSTCHSPHKWRTPERQSTTKDFYQVHVWG